MIIEQPKAYKFALDPTDEQLILLSNHAGTARWAYNEALRRKTEAHQKWRTEVDALVESGLDEKVARKQAKTKLPTRGEIDKEITRRKGVDLDERTGEVFFHWHSEVSSYAWKSALDDVERAFKNWFDSLSGKRAGKHSGYPKFKKKGRARDSFRIYHNRKKPTIRVQTYRRLNVPRLGEIRLHESAKRLARTVRSGRGEITSVTISRGGKRWYASVLVHEKMDVPDPTTKRGAVGVDVGVNRLATMSDGTKFTNARIKDQYERRITKAAKRLARTTRGSVRRRKAAYRLGHLHHREALERARQIHHLTKTLATDYSLIKIEDLRVQSMSRSAKGTIESPGKNVRAKSRLNRSLADASFGEIGRQLDYKTGWYGSRVERVPARNTSKTCSACGVVRTKPLHTYRVFKCERCGLVMDRDLNAARNILKSNPVTSDRGETLTARGGAVSPATTGARAVEARRPGREVRSPIRSDPDSTLVHTPTPVS